MLIGERLRQIREEKELSQGDVEKATGVLRCYISRVENEHTVPSVETLEKLARGMDVPLYQLFYEGTEPPAVLKIVKTDSRAELWGANGEPAMYMRRLLRCSPRPKRQTASCCFIWCRNYHSAICGSRPLTADEKPPCLDSALLAPRLS